MNLVCEDEKCYFCTGFRFAAIAQLVEHFIRNEKVGGSSPPRGSQ